MSHTIRVSDATYFRAIEAMGSSGKSMSEVVDDSFAYADAMGKKLKYEKLTGRCLRCGSMKSQKTVAHYG